MSGRGRGKRKAPMVAESGTGYGGQKDDTKRLLAARKKAEKSAIKDDKASIRFLKQIQKQLQYQKNASKGGWIHLDDDDSKKVSALLADTFRNQVPADWDARKELYNLALDVCRDLASNETLGVILGDKDDQEGILYWLLDFSAQAKDILNKFSTDSGPIQTTQTGLAGKISGVLWGSSSGSSGFGSKENQDSDDLLLASQVSEVADAALKMSRRCQAPKQVADLSVISLSERYQSQLGPLRYDSVESIQNHFFMRTIPHAPASLDARALFKELAAYRTALPVEYGSSCFCRIIDSRVDMLRVMITGPDDTPYANGCFFFDINLPANYPQVAPKVQFLTTGGGKIRFNPNLYNCGKVCLSLLGTWSGPGWISGQSTLLQVLISIQSLILVPDPYFNEPGWETDRGTQRGATHSKAYNQKIRRYTASAAIEAHLSSILGNSNQYAEFELVMKRHFLEKRSLIQKELWSWVKDDPTLSPSVSHICNLFEQLATRERGTTRKRNRGVAAVARNATQSNEPIVLDDSDVESIDSHQVRPVSGALKSNETIEIDLSDNEEEKKEDPPGDTKSGDGLIDLTL